MAGVSEAFSVERHRDVAEWLNATVDRLESLRREVSGPYGRGAVEATEAAVAALDSVRQLLDRQFDRDFPIEPGLVGNVRLGSVYFPEQWHEQRRAG